MQFGNTALGCLIEQWNEKRIGIEATSTILETLLINGAIYEKWLHNDHVRHVVDRLPHRLSEYIYSGSAGVLHKDVCGIVAEYLFVRGGPIRA